MGDNHEKPRPIGREKSPQIYASAKPSETLEIVARILSSFPERDSSDNGMDGRLRGYLVAVEGYSVAVLLDAERRILRGTVADFDPRFMPTPPQLARLCDHIRGEHYRRSLPPSLPLNPEREASDEERARMVGKFKALSAGL